jgi:hypothetical protein
MSPSGVVPANGAVDAEVTYEPGSSNESSATLTLKVRLRVPFPFIKLFIKFFSKSLSSWGKGEYVLRISVNILRIFCVYFGLAPSAFPPPHPLKFASLPLCSKCTPRLSLSANWQTKSYVNCVNWHSSSCDPL